MVHRRTFVIATAGVLLGRPTAQAAQDNAVAPRIILFSAFARDEVETYLNELRIHLAKLGWTDGRNIALMEPRTTAGDNASLPRVAVEVVAQRPAVILVQSVPAARAAAQATKSIPIVMVGVGNPVELGIVADFARPGGNITGTSYLANEFAVKLLHFLKEAVPRLSSVAVFVNRTNEHAAQYSKQVAADASTLGILLHVVPVAGPGDFEAAFASIRSARAESILLPPEPLIRSHRHVIADFARANALPLVIQGDKSLLPAGGLMAFGPATDEYARLGARFVDRILRGAKPGELPIEQPMQFDLVISLRAAEALGLTIPQALRQRAELIG